MNKTLVISSIGSVSEVDDPEAVLIRRGLKKKDLRRLTLGEKRLLAACIKTLKQGKLANTGDSYPKGGIIAGSNWGNVGSGFSEEEHALFDHNFMEASPISLLKFVSSMPTNRCSIMFGLKSVSVTFSGGESSGLQAIIEAARLLKNIANVDFILAGSFEVLTQSRLKLLKILNANLLKSILFRFLLFTRLLFKKEQVFKYLWKSQDKEPVLLGGAGTVLVEPLEKARERGLESENILAVIKDYSQIGIHNKIDVSLFKEQLAKMLNDNKDGSAVDAVISLHHPGKKNRGLEKKILKKTGFKGKFFCAETVVGENFSVSDIGAVAFAASLFNFTTMRRILIDSFGQCSYTGLLIEKYDESC
jgi:hypothetical protein